MDEKNPTTVNNPAPKEPLNKPEKKQGLTVSNSKQKPNTNPDTDNAPAAKLNPVAPGNNPARVPQRTAELSSPPTLPVKTNITTEPKGNTVKRTEPSPVVQTVAMSTIIKDEAKQDLLPAAVRPIKQEYQESKPWSNRTKAEVSPIKQEYQDSKPWSNRTKAEVSPIKQEYQDSKPWSNRTKAEVSPIKQEYEESKPWSNRTKAEVSPSEQLQVPSSQRNANYRCVKVMESDEETSARTNTIYAKNMTGVNSNSKLSSVQAACFQRVAGVAHDAVPKSSSPQQFSTLRKGREVIDLTSDDSPPRPQTKSHSVAHVQGSQGNKQDVSKVSPKLVSGKDADGRRHASQSQLRKEYEGSSRHHSIREMQPSNETPPIYDALTYGGQPQGKPKVLPQLPASSPVTMSKKSLDEVYPSGKQETGIPKHDKKRHQRAMVESLDGRFTHSPSSDSVDEHFAEWFRRQSSVPQHTKPHFSHQRHTGNPELSKLKYGYVTDEVCPPDCPCSLPASREEEIMSVPHPKPKEHYEEDLPFAGVTLYPGRWSPTLVAADHPDLYISSHAAHLPPPPDSLANHMCTASRIFIPTAQIFSPPYHLGMPPMGGPPLIAGTDDQLHIHPHCLMASSYPCTSSSRTPDGAPYPLYSFT